MVTRNDVARKAGVSVAVVSYVLNNKSIVKDETRRKVLEAMEELGYRPNPTARSLKTKKYDQIAVLTNFIGNPFEAGILLHLEEAARSSGYMVTYQTYAAGSDEDWKSLLAGRFDGIVLLGQSLEAGTMEFLRKREIPVVSVMKPVREEIPLIYVDVDWDSAYRQMLHALWAQGHRRIAFMTHGDRHDPLQGRWERFNGILHEEEPFGRMECILLEGQGKYEGAYRQITGLHDADFTAVVCANDLMAIGTIAACRDRGWTVPERFSVLGSENILMTTETCPPVSVLHFPREEAALLAFDKLNRLIRNEGEAVESEELEAGFIRRASLGMA